MALTKVANTLLDFTGGFVAGNVSFPAITTVGDTNTGVFFPAADTIAFAEGGAESARIDSGGNMIIGGISPTTSSGYTSLSINNATNSGYLILQNNGTNKSDWFVSGGTVATLRGVAVPLSLEATGANHVKFETNGSERMRLDSNGKLLLGVTTGTGLSNSDFAMVNGGSIRFRNAANSAYISAFYFTPSNGLDIGTGGSLSTITFGISGIGEVSRFDTSGNLLVGTTSAGDGKVRISASANAFNLLKMDDTGTTTGNYIQFLNSAGNQAGSINHNGTTTVNYGSGSDYRLKENVQQMVGALETVAQLKPCTYIWKTDGSVGQGFIAHELQTIIPDAVVGEKDAVNEDGSIKTQTVDTSFLVATLTAAIQEQQALITQLQADVAALKGA